MGQADHLVFGSFRLDPVRRRLWRGEQELELRPMAVAVLQDLVEHAGQLVTKEELLKRVWAGTYVTKTVLKVCVREIREALGDEAAAPRYIETVGWQGYRFLERQPPKDSDATPESPSSGLRAIVGRAREISQLERGLAQAARGKRQIIFVTGEPGIGKTTVVDLFMDHVRARGQVRIGRGQCLEQYGEGEAYLPVLEAFGRLCREPGGSQLRNLLGQYAPTWLVQMSALLTEAELKA